MRNFTPNIQFKNLKYWCQLGLCLIIFLDFGFTFAYADQRSPELRKLFSDLKSTDSQKYGDEITSKIWQIWTTHSYNTALSKQMRMGIELMQSGQLSAANAVFTNVISQDNEFAEAWNKRATVLFFLGEFERAKLDIAKTLELENNHFGALAGLGMVEIHLGNPKAALRAYKRATLINPHLKDVKQAILRLEKELKGLPT